MKGTWYLSGPMSGYDKFNYPTFERITKFLRDLGLTVISPHEIPVPPDTLPKEEVWRYYMDICLEQMKQCDRIILLQGWPESAGAKTEFEFALKNKMEVFYFIDSENTLIRMSRP